MNDEGDKNRRTGDTMDNGAGSTFHQSKSNAVQFSTYTNKKKPPTIYPTPSNFFPNPSISPSLPVPLPPPSPSPSPPLPPVPVVTAEALQALVNSRPHPSHHHRHHQPKHNNTKAQPPKRHVTFPPVLSSFRASTATPTKKTIVQPPSRWLDTHHDLPKCRVCHQAVKPQEAVLGRPCLHGPFHAACIEAEEELCVAAAHATNRVVAPQLHCPVCLGVVSSIAFNLSNEIPSTRLPFANVMKPSAPNVYNGTTRNETGEDFTMIRYNNKNDIDKIQNVQQERQHQRKEQKEEQRQHSMMSATVFVPSDGCKRIEYDRFKVDVDVHIIHHFPQCHQHQEAQPSCDANRCGENNCKAAMCHRYENRKHQHQHRQDHYYHHNRRQSSTGGALPPTGKNHNHSRHGSTHHKRR